MVEVEDASVQEQPQEAKVEVEDLELKSYYDLARRALRENNGENTAKYFALVIQKRPYDWEANFYQVFGTANGCKIRDIRFAQSNVAAALKSAYALIKEHVKDEEEQVSACAQISQSAINLARAHFQSALNWYNSTSFMVRGKFRQEMINYTYACVLTAYTVEIHYLIYLLIMPKLCKQLN